MFRATVNSARHGGQPSARAVKRIEDACCAPPSSPRTRAPWLHPVRPDRSYVEIYNFFITVTIYERAPRSCACISTCKMAMKALRAA